MILCAKAGRNQIELTELDKSGIAAAEYIHCPISLKTVIIPAW
jgi:hypothetical protein